MIHTHAEKHIAETGMFPEPVAGGMELKRLFNMIPDMICIADRSGYFKYLNPAWVEVLGFSLAELMARPFIDLVHPDDRVITLDVLDKLLKAQGVYQKIENRCRCLDGSFRTLAWRAVANGDTLYAAARDISERKLAENALVESEARYRHIVTNAPAGIFEIDYAANRFLSANDLLCEHLGYTLTELLSLNPFDIIADESKPLLVKRLHLVEQGIAPSDSDEYKIKRKDGSEFWSLVFFRYFFEGRRLTKSTAVVQDITARKTMENELRRQKELLQTILDHIPLTVSFKDRQGRFQWVNHTWEQTFGTALADIDQTDIWQACYPDPEVRYQVKRFMRKAEGIWQRFQTRLQSGALIDLSLINIELSDGTKITIGENITESIKAEKKQQELRAQLYQAQKMEALGALAGGIAHDFNNILSSIMGYTELAVMTDGSGSSQQRYMKEIYTASQRARDLVRQILTFARRADVEIKPVKVALIAREALKLLRSTIPSSIEIKQSIQSQSLVMGDAIQIHQVFMNLLTNAAQAMEDTGGTLEVALRDETLVSSVGDLKPGEYMRITVKDTGVGIAAEHLPSIFNPYFTTKAPGKGTGLGLAVVHGIIKSYGGDIQVCSQKGAGASFSLHLPLTGNAHKVLNAPQVALPTGTETILMIDDEPTIAHLMSETLERLGYQAVVQTGSVEALELFRADPDRFDLVITDMTMPVMNGDKLAAEMTTLRPGLPVIMCTGYSNMISEENTLAAGIRAILIKPVAVADLASTVRRVLV